MALLIGIPELILSPFIMALIIHSFAKADSGAVGLQSSFAGFQEALRSYWPLLRFSIHYSILIGLGFIAFVIPAFIFYKRYCFGFFIIFLEKANPSKAFEKSRELTGPLGSSILPLAALELFSAIAQMAMPQDLSLLLKGTIALAQNIFTFTISWILFRLYQKQTEPQVTDASPR